MSRQKQKQERASKQALELNTLSMIQLIHFVGWVQIPRMGRPHINSFTFIDNEINEISMTMTTTIDDDC